MCNTLRALDAAKAAVRRRATVEPYLEPRDAELEAMENRADAALSAQAYAAPVQSEVLDALNETLIAFNHARNLVAYYVGPGSRFTTESDMNAALAKLDAALNAAHKNFSSIGGRC
jgi:hypothetical protein